MQEKIFKKLKIILTAYASVLERIACIAPASNSAVYQVLTSLEQALSRELIAYQKAAAPVIGSLSADDRESLKLLYGDIKKNMGWAKSTLHAELDRTSRDLKDMRQVMAVSGASAKTHNAPQYIDIVS